MATSGPTFTLRGRGPFSLTAASRFGRGFTPSPTAGDDEHIRLAFPCEDAGWRTVGVRLSHRDGDVLGEVTVAGRGGADAPVLAAATDQCRRILSLDVDGDGFAEVGRRDPVVTASSRATPGCGPCCSTRRTRRRRGR